MSNPITVYQTIEEAYAYRLRGTNQQTDVGLLWKLPSYKVNNSGVGLPTYGIERTPGLGLGYFSIQNRSGAAAVVGLGVRIPNRLWVAGQWVDATNTFTDDTADAQNTTTNDFPLETTTTSDGYVIASPVKFNAVTINVTTASVDAGTVARAVRYSNTAGTGWTNFPANAIWVQDGAALNYVAGENLVVFEPQTDWGRVTAISTIPTGWYAINVRSTDEPATTAGLAKAIEVCRLYFLKEAVADNGTNTQDFGAHEARIGWDDREGLFGDALVALVAGTGTDYNSPVTVLVRAA